MLLTTSAYYIHYFKEYEVNFDMYMNLYGNAVSNDSFVAMSNMKTLTDNTITDLNEPKTTIIDKCN